MATILIVDDDPSMVFVLTEVVRAAGHTVVTAGNGIDALRLARRHLPALIICDVIMPGMNGHHLVAAIRADPNLAMTLIILMSGSFRPEQRRFTPPTIILPKPFDIGVIEGVLALVSSAT